MQLRVVLQRSAFQPFQQFSLNLAFDIQYDHSLGSTSNARPKLNRQILQLRHRVYSHASPKGLVQLTTNLFQSLVTPPYRLNAQLSVNQAEQQIIDAALKNRIIEFESGSAVLAASGTQILDEMAVALNKVGGKKVKIIGHTDSSGDAAKNLVLSKERAVTVKNYLINKSISAERLSVEGLGSNKPVADNATADGRKKNRRIEFDVI